MTALSFIARFVCVIGLLFVRIVGVQVGQQCFRVAVVGLLGRQWICPLSW